MYCLRGIGSSVRMTSWKLHKEDSKVNCFNSAAPCHHQICSWLILYIASSKLREPCKVVVWYTCVGWTLTLNKYAVRMDWLWYIISDSLWMRRKYSCTKIVLTKQVASMPLGLSSTCMLSGATGCSSGKSLLSSSDYWPWALHRGEPWGPMHGTNNWQI